MVLAIRDSFSENLPTLTWMDKVTQEKAKEKRDKMEFLIGYPDKWRAYDFKLDPKNFSSNALTANVFELQRTLAKIGKPVDRTEWYMTPATVNAYYDSSVNQMVFPAGILQPPFYSPKASVAVNMGAMGMVVGHELTHGFDDHGAQYDAYGNLKDWWSPTDKENFKEKTKCVVEQYNKYEALPGLFVNGALTTGENIADIGGVKFSFQAYRSLRKGDTKTYIADGFTEDQQFFLGFAQAWCANPREEYLKLRVATDEHSPSKWRVNGAVSSNPIFAEAFNCKAGKKMRPATACIVW
jgi:putative endopeptidase